MNIDMILTNMKEYLNEYELDELGECGMPCFLPSWSSDSWILGPEHMSESAMQHRYHLHETLQATGEVKTRQILQERLKRNAVYIMYCHDVVSIEILLFSLKMQFWSKKWSFLWKELYTLGTFSHGNLSHPTALASLASAICCDRRAPRGSANRAPKDSHPPREWMHGLWRADHSPKPAFTTLVHVIYHKHLQKFINLVFSY